MVHAVQIFRQRGEEILTCIKGEKQTTGASALEELFEGSCTGDKSWNKCVNGGRRGSSDDGKPDAFKM